MAVDAEIFCAGLCIEKTGGCEHVDRCYAVPFSAGNHRRQESPQRIANFTRLSDFRLSVRVVTIDVGRNVAKFVTEPGKQVLCLRPSAGAGQKAD